MSETRKNLSLDEKMNYLTGELHRAMREVGFPAMVFVIRAEGDEFIAGRYPGCDDSCDTMALCTVKVFAEAGSDLTRQAAKILASEVEALPKPIKKGDFIQ